MKDGWSCSLLRKKFALTPMILSRYYTAHGCKKGSIYMCFCCFQEFVSFLVQLMQFKSSPYKFVCIIQGIGIYDEIIQHLMLSHSLNTKISYLGWNIPVSLGPLTTGSCITSLYLLFYPLNHHRSYFITA